MRINASHRIANEFVEGGRLFRIDVKMDRNPCSML